MSVRTRLFLVITLVVLVCTVSTAAIAAWLGWRAILARAREDATVTVQLLARASGLTERSTEEILRLTGERLKTESQLTAAYLDEAQRGGVGDPFLRPRLRELAARTGVDEIWLVPDGEAATLVTADPLEAPPAEGSDPTEIATLQPLIEAERTALASESVLRAHDNRRMIYGGARLAATDGLIILGEEISSFADASSDLGLGRLLEVVLAARGIDAIWVFDERLTVVESRALADLEGPAVPSPLEQDLAAGAIETGLAISRLADASLSVAAPIPDRDGIPAGAALMRLPTAPLRAELDRFVHFVGSLTLGLALFGLLCAAATARYLARPVVRITDAALAVERRSFAPDSLVGVVDRQDELGRLARVFQGMATELLDRERTLDQLVQQRTAELVQKSDELAQAYAQIDQELLTAQALQRAILPQGFPLRRGFEGHALMLPARQLSGDFYDVVELDDGRLGLLIADVAGKGVPAAFFMGISRTVLQGAAAAGLAPGACLAHANSVLCRTNPMDLFVTVFYALLDPQSGLLCYSNGGHNPPLLLRRNGAAPERLPMTGGIALGVMPGAHYAERSLSLAVGDMLFLYTDGIVEAVGPAGVEYGEERLEAALVDGADLPVDVLTGIIATAVRQHVGDAPLSDDLTCLALRYTGIMTSPTALRDSPK